ncbi:MAG: hypothetical protein NTV09_01460 [Bacteroidetes bacterium]|nr:hypothetical protein [Bacteroidota bacterium]
MKKLRLTIAALMLTAGVYAQADSAGKMTPPDMKNRNDGMHQDKNNDLINNPGHEMNNPVNQNRTMRQDPNLKNSNPQNTRDNSNSQTDQDKMQNHSDGYMMQNGKMMIVKDGKMTRMENDITLANGTTIMSNGNYMKKGGTKVMLKEGEHIDLSGKMPSMKTNKDKNMYLVPDSTGKKEY